MGSAGSRFLVLGAGAVIAACSAGGPASVRDVGAAAGAPGAAGDDAGATSGAEGSPEDGGGSTDADAAGAVGYVPVTLGFDDVALGTKITTQYAAHATFSSDPGCALETDQDTVTSSNPNLVMTYYSCDTGENASVFVDFAKPVRELSFMAIGVNDTTKVATLHVVTRSGTSSVDLVGRGDPDTPFRVDLTKYTDVTRLEVTDVTDSYGLGFDDFAFEEPSR